MAAGVVMGMYISLFPPNDDDIVVAKLPSEIIAGTGNLGRGACK